jgi:hypothetical protein
MPKYTYVQPERVWLKGNPDYSEKWVQDRIAEKPAILGLGDDLVLKDRERSLPHAGRLDLLLQDEDNRRYEVEVQLGATDESHIIRTIEYWDDERKSKRQFDHCAVIVAEEITARFLNVISLFNGHIPLIALQMSALRMGDQFGLVFTTVLDELRLGLDEEDEEQEVTDRAWWENKGSKETVHVADELLEMIHNYAPTLALKYNKFYIGLADDGQPNNFVIFRPKKNHIGVEPRLRESDDTRSELDEAGLDLMEYDKAWGRYRIRLSPKDLKTHADLIRRILKRAYDNARG